MWSSQGISEGQQHSTNQHCLLSADAALCFTFPCVTVAMWKWNETDPWEIRGFSTSVVVLYPSEQDPQSFWENCPFTFWSSSVTAHRAMFALSTISLGFKRNPRCKKISYLIRNIL